jgi:hypothetical protein
MPPVNSSAIKFIDYDQDTRQLFITFKEGKPYTYYDVPEVVYQSFLNAASKGKFFQENIKDRYSKD